VHYTCKHSSCTVLQVVSTATPTCVLQLTGSRHPFPTALSRTGPDQGLVTSSVPLGRRTAHIQQSVTTPLLILPAPTDSEALTGNRFPRTVIDASNTSGHSVFPRANGSPHSSSRSLPRPCDFWTYSGEILRVDDIDIRSLASQQWGSNGGRRGGSSWVHKETRSQAGP
jgi:hypothetical protein